MITTDDLQCPVSITISSPAEDHLEMSRLLAAAVVSPSFCRLLLVDPQQAIENGYQGETFLLSDADRYLILSIHADSLPDLARQVVQAREMDLHPRLSYFAQAPVSIGF